MFRLSPRHICLASLLSIGLFPLFHRSSSAACLPGGCHQNGLIFQEASPNFQITDITGTGSLNNPFVIYQDVWGLDISLAIDGLPHARQHAVFQRPGFAINIVARNLTGAFWRFYDHELQEMAGQASHENDGLSFAQGIGPARPYTTTHYTRADEITDVRDFVNFHQGQGVHPGEQVLFSYLVTDTIPNQRFFIRQRPDYRPNTSPTPITRPQPPAPIDLEGQPAQAEIVPPINSERPQTDPVSTPEAKPSTPGTSNISAGENIVQAQPIPEPTTPLASISALLLSMRCGPQKIYQSRLLKKDLKL